MAWLTGWSNRKKLTIDHDQVDGALTDFPVYVKLAGDTDVGAAARADGHDLRFTQSDGTTLLKYERESFDITGGSCTADIWVKLPSISAVADTDFYIYYGKADAADGEDAANVWDSDFVGVWHLSEEGDEIGEDFLDSTSNANHGQGGDGTAGRVPVRATGKVGYGQDFDGGDYIDAEDDPSMDVSRLTASHWVNYDVQAGWESSFARSDANVTLSGMWAFLTPTSDKFSLRLRTSATAVYVDSAVTFSAGTWYHVAVRWDGSDLYLYQDGVERDSAAIGGSMGAIAKSVTLGCRHVYTGAIDGKVDECRVSGVDRGAAWIAFEHDNIANYATVLTHGAEESGASGQADLRRIGSPLGGSIAFPVQG